MRERADSAARGSDVPAGLDRGTEAAASGGALERGRMRRRLRELRRLRESQLLELGALVLEAHRHSREDTPVVKRKTAEVAATDAELRALAEALGTEAGLDAIEATGIAVPCPTCGTLASTSARFCSACGTALDGRPDATPRTAATTEPVSEEPATEERGVEPATEQRAAKRAGGERASEERGAEPTGEEPEAGPAGEEPVGVATETETLEPTPGRET